MILLNLIHTTWEYAHAYHDGKILESNLGKQLEFDR